MIFYILFQLGIIILAIVSYFVWDKRYKKSQGFKIPEGYVRTEEVNIDPKTGCKLRVYYNPNTGKRFYHEES